MSSDATDGIRRLCKHLKRVTPEPTHHMLDHISEFADLIDREEKLTLDLIEEMQRELEDREDD